MVVVVEMREKEVVDSGVMSVKEIFHFPFNFSKYNY